MTYGDSFGVVLLTTAVTAWLYCYLYAWYTLLYEVKSLAEFFSPRYAFLNHLLFVTVGLKVLLSLAWFVHWWTN